MRALDIAARDAPQLAVVGTTLVLLAFSARSALSYFFATPAEQRGVELLSLANGDHVKSILAAIFQFVELSLIASQTEAVLRKLGPAIAVARGGQRLNSRDATSRAVAYDRRRAQLVFAP